MKVTVVVDNGVPISARSPFRAEHGLSLLIEHHNNKILFDMGQSDIVVHNLSLLAIHPAQIDILVLSHGHYDHAGGLLPFLYQGNKRYPLYADTDIFAPRYSVAGGSRFFIGIPYSREQLTSLGIDWRLGTTAVEIAPNLWYSGRIPRHTNYELGDKKLVTHRDGCDCQDTFEDDCSLFYLSGEELVVIGGCTHSGLVNTIRYGLELTGAKCLKGWIGGTHLGPVSQAQQDATLAALAEFAPQFVMAGHCTGFWMMAELARRLGDRFIPAFVGTALEF